MSGCKPRAAAAAAASALALAGLGLASTATAASPGQRPGPIGDAIAAIRAPAGQLANADQVAVPGGGSVHRFRQRVGGLPVLGAEAVLVSVPGRRSELVVDHTRPGLEPPGDDPIARRVAIRRARRAAGVERLRARARSRLVVEPRLGRLAWEVMLPAARPVADLAVLVDASNGEAIRRRDLLWRQDAVASARLFDPNPVVSNGGYFGLTDNRDRGSDLLTSLRLPVALPRISSARGCLTGVHVDARMGRERRRVCKRSLAWGGARRATNAFEALMAYFHVDRTRAYLDSLGLAVGLGSRPQRVAANAFGEDNSFYSPIGRAVALGTGGVDDGEDADVIIHEYGHAVQDRQVRFFGETAQGTAMGEGFGDYLAAVMSALATGGNPRFDPCMFEWDAVSYTRNRCARRTDTALTRARAKARCAGDPHCTGEAWSGALWELRAELGADEAGRSVVDRILLESHLMLARRSGFRDGARALLTADRLLYDGVHRPAIQAELIERGFCPAPRC